MWPDTCAPTTTRPAPSTYSEASWTANGMMRLLRCIPWRDEICADRTIPRRLRPRGHDARSGRRLPYSVSGDLARPLVLLTGDGLLLCVTRDGRFALLHTLPELVRGAAQPARELGKLASAKEEHDCDDDDDDDSVDTEYVSEDACRHTPSFHGDNTRLDRLAGSRIRPLRRGRRGAGA